MKLHNIQSHPGCDQGLMGVASACIPLFFKRGGHDYPGNRG